MGRGRISTLVFSPSCTLISFRHALQPASAVTRMMQQLRKKYRAMTKQIAHLAVTEDTPISQVVGGCIALSYIEDA